MKYKNAKYRFHADGSFDEKKEQKKRSGRRFPAKKPSESAPHGEYLAFLTELGKSAPKKDGGMTFTRLKKASGVKNDRAAMKLAEKAVREGVLERREGLFILTAAGKEPGRETPPATSLSPGASWATRSPETPFSCGCIREPTGSWTTERS